MKTLHSNIVRVNEHKQIGIFIVFFMRLKKLSSVLMVIVTCLFLLISTQIVHAHYGVYSELGHPNNTGRVYHTHHSSFRTDPYSGTYYGDEGYVCEETREFSGESLSLSEVVHNFGVVHECIYRHDSCEYPDTADCRPARNQCSDDERRIGGFGGNVACEPIASRGPLGLQTNNGYPDSCSGGSNVYTSHPIHIGTGNKYFSQDIYTGQGLRPLQLRFSYNSNTSKIAWTIDYQQFLTISDTTILARRGDGRKLYFAKEGEVILSQTQARQVTLSLSNDVYTLQLPNNIRETYNLAGQLLAIYYPEGIIHELSYSNSNNTIAITRRNEVVTLYKTDSVITHIVLPDGSTTHFSWDTSGDINRLVNITHPDNSSRTYLYENNDFTHYVTGIIDENGHRISSVSYDEEGRAVSSEVGELGSGIERSQIEYLPYEGDYRYRRIVTNALGKKTAYSLRYMVTGYVPAQVEGHASDNCAAANQAYTYDTNGFMTSKTDWNGNVTTYIHNSRGLETSRTEASGTADARTITTEWHPTFNLRTQVVEPERKITFTYDNNGHLTSQEVSPR